MPEVERPDQASVQDAYNNFWNDFYEVVKAQDSIEEYLPSYGINEKFDTGLVDLVQRQKQILFDLRTIYGELYEFFNVTQQASIGDFIRRATISLSEGRLPSGLSGLGIAPFILAGGIVVSIIAGGALLAYHRNISLQKDRLAMQVELIPLVAAGKLPPEVLEPPPVSPGVFQGLFSNIGTLILIGVGIYFLWPIIQEKVLKKSE